MPLAFCARDKVGPAFAIGLACALSLAASPADALWRAGRAADASGAAYLAVVNDADDGSRFEFNCTPSGQAFVAVTVRPDAPADGAGAYALRFLVDGSHRFVARARVRTLGNGWDALELDETEIIAPLTQILAISQGRVDVDVTNGGAALTTVSFDMGGARDAFSLYRTYCHF